MKLELLKEYIKVNTDTIEVHRRSFPNLVATVAEVGAIHLGLLGVLRRVYAQCSCSCLLGVIRNCSKATFTSCSNCITRVLNWNLVEPTSEVKKIWSEVDKMVYCGIMEILGTLCN